MIEKKQQDVWKKWFRRGVLVLLILAAAGLWWIEGREQMGQAVHPTETPAPAAPRDERLKRETAYDRDVAALQAILESGAADEATQEMAAQKLAKLIEEHQNEIGLEEALQEADYANAVVIVQNNAVTVMIPEEMLNEESSAQILTLCVVHAGIGPENVRVMGIE